MDDDRDHLAELLEPPSPWNPVFFVTLAASGVGWVGHKLGIPWLYWSGVVACGLVLFMNVASGSYREQALALPFLVVVGTMLYMHSWLLGTAFGLLIWTTIEAAMMFMNAATWRRR